MAIQPIILSPPRDRLATSGFALRIGSAEPNRSSGSRAAFCLSPRALPRPGMEPMPGGILAKCNAEPGLCDHRRFARRNRAATPVGRFSLQHDPGIRLRPPSFRRRWPGKRDSPDSTSKPAW